jgi:hypothetical protein
MRFLFDHGKAGITLGQPHKKIGVLLNKGSSLHKQKYLMTEMIDL